MPFKKRPSPTADVREKDVESLFSRAGLIGAKYRVFPRREAVLVSVPPWVGPTLPRQASAAVFTKQSVPVPDGTSPSGAPQPATSPAFRWSSLRRIFDGRLPESDGHRIAGSGLKLAILSLAGGAGKTTLAVTLARTLSGLQHRVLLAEGGLFPAIPIHFGSSGERFGLLRFFYPPCGMSGFPVGLFQLPLAEADKTEWSRLLEQVEASESVLLMDVPTLQCAGLTELVTCATHILVPITPDVGSIASLDLLRNMLIDRPSADVQVYFLINRFDPTRPLHHEIRHGLTKKLGDRLLPFVVQEDPEIAEAAANGMTIVDYRSGSPAVRDMNALAEWAEQLPQPIAPAEMVGAG
ncbi:Cellulose synthase, putative [Acidisarcina polymorpha]|uniref:Cellulose synthase, putative n=1 Tax=Acidisarcina polymorpha TaxID=2211140 RepID=A0A2Z5G2A1_9BACT|nr:cellulose synthase operon protein YhjQ/BcsQ [Acidisarcina polymorpha]AXC12944.1 Cellulose synthase, putative [Acidisarcina polymorpha]